VPVFPTIPTVAANTLIESAQATATTTHTFGSLTTLDNASGDLLIAVIVLYQASGTANAFSTWGGGFTEFGDSASAVNPSMAMGCAYKISNGTETGTFTVTSSISGRSAMFLMSIKDWHGTTVPEVAFSAATTATAQDPPNLDPTGWAAEDTLWIAVAAAGQTSLTGTWTGITSAPASYTDYAESAIVGGDVIGACQIAVAFRGNTVSAEDPGVFTTDTSPEIERAATIAVRPTANRTGTATPTQDDQTSTASGTVASGDVTGTVAVTQADQTSTAAGSVTAPPSVTRSMVAGSDDSKEAPSLAPDPTTTTVLLDLVGYHMGLRFTDLPIQNGADIFSAAVSLTLSSSDKNDAEGTWYAHDIDDAATFTTTEGDVDGRTKTTASVAWTTNDLGTAGARITSPDLAAVIQEVVDRPGWQPGNNIALIYVHNSASDKLEVAAYEHATDLAPSITITYQSIPIVNGVAQGHWTFTGTAVGTLGAGGGITGTVAVTQADQTSTATGVLGYTGTAAVTQDDQTSTATGVLGYTGTSATIQADQTSTASGVLGYSGTVAITQEDQISTATGGSAAPGVSGSVAATQDDQTSTATGVLGYTGTSATTQADQTSTASGTSAAPGISGSVAATQDDQTSTAAGVLGYSGTSATVQADQTATASGWVTVTGTVAVIQADQTSTASGTVSGAVVVPGIPVAVQDPSHAVTVTDPAELVFATDFPTALVITTNGQHSAAVSDTAKIVTVQDNDHSLMVSTPD
jgi:hypothetical protein